MSVREKISALKNKFRQLLSQGNEAVLNGIIWAEDARIFAEKDKLPEVVNEILGEVEVYEEDERVNRFFLKCIAGVSDFVYMLNLLNSNDHVLVNKLCRLVAYFAECTDISHALVTKIGAKLVELLPVVDNAAFALKAMCNSSYNVSVLLKYKLLNFNTPEVSTLLLSSLSSVGSNIIRSEIMTPTVMELLSRNMHLYQAEVTLFHFSMNPDKLRLFPDAIQNISDPFLRDCIQLNMGLIETIQIETANKLIEKVIEKPLPLPISIQSAPISPDICLRTIANAKRNHRLFFESAEFMGFLGDCLRKQSVAIRRKYIALEIIRNLVIYTDYREILKKDLVLLVRIQNGSLQDTFDLGEDPREIKDIKRNIVMLASQVLSEIDKD